MGTKYINKKGYPEYAVEMLKQDDYDYDFNPNVISVTSLLKPARAWALINQYDGDLLVDVDDMIAIQGGNALHDKLSQVKCDGISIQEKRFKSELPVKVYARDITISGKPDLVFQGRLVDMKTTSVWGWIFGEFDDYVKQLSVYRWLLAENGIQVHDKGEIFYWFTDWKRSEGKYNQSYPDSRIKFEQYELMSIQETENFMVDNCHRLLNALSYLPECTDEERWKSEDKWALTKDGAKKATKLYDNEQEAVSALKDGYYIDYRKGLSKRCNYCNARSICIQAIELEKQGLIADK